jgi:hypothetical protein
VAPGKIPWVSEITLGADLAKVAESFSAKPPERRHRFGVRDIGQDNDLDRLYRKFGQRSQDLPEKAEAREIKVKADRNKDPGRLCPVVTGMTHLHIPGSACRQNFGVFETTEIAYTK